MFYEIASGRTRYYYLCPAASTEPWTSVSYEVVIYRGHPTVSARSLSPRRSFTGPHSVIHASQVRTV
eukprot:1012859-Prymnesium_polylepis.1